jgi:hypothetical protein
VTGKSSDSLRAAPSSADGGGNALVGADGGALGNTSSHPSCGSTPTRFLSMSDLASPGMGLSAAMDLAVNATDLYVADSTDTGALLRVPLRGGATMRIAAVEGSEQSMALSTDYVVFSEAHAGNAGGWSGEIVRIGLDGSDRTVLFSGDVAVASIFGPAGTLVTDGKNAYFATGGGVMSVPLSGGPATTLTTHTGAIALVGSSVVVADSAAGGLFRVPVAGGSATTLVSGLTGNLGPVVACGSSVCWASEVEVGPSMQGTATLQQLDASGGATTLSQGDALYVVYRLLFDGTEFFATMLADASVGSLARVPAAGGTPVVGGDFGAGIAVDDECLYVADIIDGVYSVAKDAWMLAPPH